MEPDFSRQVFQTYTNIKFHENPSSERPVCCMRTDGLSDRHEANDPSSQFFERA